MTSAGTVRHRVVVVRVELPDADDEPMRIELLEVLPQPGPDRLIGRAVDAAGACRVLRTWFDQTLACRPRDSH